MINSSKNNRGFITLTITLIIIILVTILSLMTGRMLMNEQRTTSNKLRYEEAASAAQAGIDAALVRLSLENDFRTSFSNSSVAPYYQVNFGTDSSILTGDYELPIVTIHAVGTSGYSAGATDPDEAEAKVTIEQKAFIGRVVTGIPDAPLTVAAGMAAGGNFSVAANPNGGGAGVPLSIWSPSDVVVYGSSSTCGQQEYYAGECSTSTYSDSKSGAGSDILQNDANFPKNLLSYVFGVTTIDGLVTRLAKLGRTVMPNCDGLDETSTGLYIVHGDCKPGKTIGSADAPVTLVVWDGDLVINGNTNIYGIVFMYSSGSINPKIQLTGGATVYGALVATDGIDNSAGSYTAVYDADVLANIENGSQFSYVARVSSSWRDW